MTVRRYEWGERAGGSNSDNSTSPPASAPYGVPQPFSGTLGAAVVTINFTGGTKYLTIKNTHDNDSLQASYDGGTTWETIHPNGLIQEPMSISSLMLRRVSGNPTYYGQGILKD